MKTNKVLLCVDVSNNAYKASAAHAMLTNGETFTGGLYGFLGAVAKAIEQTGATHICLNLDLKPYLRSKTYPEYKALRTATKDSVLVSKVSTTLKQIKELCAITGWPLLGIDGFESDDITAHITIHYRHRFEKIIAMSNDSDLYQLFTWKHFQVYKGKKGIYEFVDFYREFGVMPQQFLKMLAITGTHNDVAGIKGIGPVGAKHAIFNKDHMNNLLKLHSEIITRNEGLIVLPHKDFPKSTQIPDYTCSFNERELIRFCSRYKIQIQRWQSEAFEKVSK